MELYESIAWIAIGFIPTLLALEIASRAARGFRLQKRREIVVGVKNARRLDER